MNVGKVFHRNLLAFYVFYVVERLDNFGGLKFRQTFKLGYVKDEINHSLLLVRLIFHHASVEVFLVKDSKEAFGLSGDGCCSQVAFMHEGVLSEGLAGRKEPYLLMNSVMRSNIYRSHFLMENSYLLF